MRLGGEFLPPCHGLDRIIGLISCDWRSIWKGDYSFKINELRTMLERRQKVNLLQGFGFSELLHCFLLHTFRFFDKIFVLHLPLTIIGSFGRANAWRTLISSPLVIFPLALGPLGGLVRIFCVTYIFLLSFTHSFSVCSMSCTYVFILAKGIFYRLAISFQCVANMTSENQYFPLK